MRYVNCIKKISNKNKAKHITVLVIISAKRQGSAGFTLKTHQ
jgi:hypothetical protein